MKIVNKKQRSILTTVTVATLIGMGLVLIMDSSKLSMMSLMPQANAATPQSSAASLKPQTLTGTVTKTLETFSFKGDHGEQYHIADNSKLLDKLAQQYGIQDPLYTLDNITFKGVVSPEGNYGHMGYYKHQITVTGL